MRYFGVFLTVFGIVDAIGNFAGYNFWRDAFGIQLPSAISSYSGYIEIAIGFAMIYFGKSSKNEGQTSVNTDQV